MKKLILFLFLICAVYSQQINYTWGYTTAGVAWTQIGSQNVDSIGTVTIVFDMQDYYWLDYYPLNINDLLTVTGSSSDTVGVDSIYGSTTATVYNNSNRHYYGTFWYYIDMHSATDTSKFLVNVYPGNMVYHPNDDSRITAANINFSTTATTIVTDTSSYTANDRQWTPVNVYVNSTAYKFLPPEFLKVYIDFVGVTNDSINVYWNFAYPAVKEYDQSMRHTIRTKGESRKAQETLH